MASVELEVVTHLLSILADVQFQYFLPLFLGLFCLLDLVTLPVPLAFAIFLSFSSIFATTGSRCRRGIVISLLFLRFLPFLRLLTLGALAVYNSWSSWILFTLTTLLSL